MALFFTRKFFTLLLSTLMMVIVASPAFAVEDSFYDVEGLRVRAKDKNELTAKRVAINFGKKQAFSDMISRFLTKHDFERLALPKLKIIDDMIRDLQLEEERYGSGIYIAVLNVRFRLENVRQYLRNIGFAYSETVARPYLLLPVFIDLRTKNVYLWEPDNIWLDVWLDSKDIGDRHLLPVYIPKNQYLDNILLKNIKQINKDAKILNQIKDYYHTDNIILLTATGEYQPSARTLKGLEVTAHFFTKDWQRDSIILKLNERNDAVKLLNTAKKNIFNEIQDQWKHNTAIELGEENNLRVKVRMSSLPEWLKIKKTLQSVPDVINFRLVQIGQGEAVIEMLFYGDADRLGRALAREFLSLSKERKDWILKTATQQGQS